MMNAVKTLAWMVLLLTLVLFSAAIVATEVIGRDADGIYDVRVPGTDEVLSDFFSSIPTAMYTLFYCFGEGCSEKIVIPVLRISPLMALFFLAFLLLTTYCFLNLIVGVFVENTLSI